MKAYTLIIAPATRDDLKAIFQFGLRRRGKAQSSQYLNDVKTHFISLTQQPLLGTERHELIPHMRSFPVKSHVIFYRAENKQIEIIRVLHGRQDPHQQMK